MPERQNNLVGENLERQIRSRENWSKTMVILFSISIAILASTPVINNLSSDEKLHSATAALTLPFLAVLAISFVTLTHLRSDIGEAKTAAKKEFKN